MNPMEPSGEALGIIAGSRGLPFTLAREARRQGIRPIVAVAFEGETDPAFAEEVDEIVWIRVGQLKKMIRAFSDRGVTRCVMAGQIAPKNLFNIRPDLKGIRLLMRLPQKNAHTIFGAIGEELAAEGVKLIDGLPWLHQVMPSKGFVWGPKPNPQQWEDLNYGFQLAKEVSRLEIGQTVVVKEGTVLAVEGFEGTDACIRRGGELAGKKKGAIAVKVAKPNHDMRFDIPCIGSATLKNAHEVGIASIGFESGKTLILDWDSTQKLCKDYRISLCGL